MCILLILMIQSNVFVQSDWSCGPDTSETVMHWTDTFLSSASVEWLETPGELTLAQFNSSSVTATSELQGAACIAPYDLDKDGDIDLACSGFSGSKLVLLRNMGNGVWEISDIDVGITGCCATAITDFNGDGHGDVVNAGETAGVISWYQNDGTATSWTKRTISPGGGHPYCLQCDDFDGDGDADLAVAMYSAGSIDVWWNMNGQGTSWNHTILKSDFSGAWWIEVGDLDADGDSDVAACSGAGSCIWLENQGTQRDWPFHQICEIPAILPSISLLDFDEDGAKDLILCSWIPGAVILFRNTGVDDQWETCYCDTDISGSWSCASGDIDGDGDDDFTANDRQGNILYFYENRNGNWIRHMLASELEKPNDVITSDISGSGALEIIGSMANGNSVEIWSLEPGFSSSGILTSSILDAGEDVAWGVIEWDAAVPAGCSLAVEVRAGQDYSLLGSWYTVAGSGDDLSLYFTDPLRFLQYRLQPSTSDSTVSPTLHSIEVNGELMGLEETGREYSIQAANPFRDFIKISLFSETLEKVNVLLFDTSGRQVNILLEDTYIIGTECFQFDLSDLPAGAYSLVVQSGNSFVTEKLVSL